MREYPETYAIWNQRDNYAYVNLAKCGCTAIKTAIAEHLGESFESIQWHLPWKVSAWNVPDTVFRFTAVRHPFARLVSCWADWVQSPSEDELQLNPDFRGIVGAGFREFCEYVLHHSGVPNLHYAPQIPQLHHNGVCLVDEIFKLEALSSEWCRLSAVTGLPPLSRNPGAVRKSKHAPWRTYYTRGLASKMADYYAEDFASLDYEPTIENRSGAKC